MSNDQQIVLPPITFFPDGPSEEIRQANLEAVLPSPGYPEAAFLIADAITKRAATVLLDYTRDMAAVRYQIDGVWHEMPNKDRQSADYMLASLKKLANLNYQERRARQEGEFGAKFHGYTSKCHLISQGVKTGERVAIKITDNRTSFKTFEDLGMRPKMLEHVREALNLTSGLVVFSNLPGDGFSTTWNVALNTCDRLMRDFFAIENAAQVEEEVINVESTTFDRNLGQSPHTVLPGLLLRQPDAFVFSEPLSSETIEMVCDLVLDHNKLVIANINSRSAIESLLRMLVLKPPVEKLTMALQAVIYSRLIRVLCEACKQPYQPPNELLAKLGIRPGRVQSFFKEYQPPPPGQMVDERGNPIQPPICVYCNGIGYRGRTAIFEFLKLNEALRNAMKGKPDMESLTRVAADSGHISLKEEGVLKIAKGSSSIGELQRVLKK